MDSLVLRWGTVFGLALMAGGAGVGAAPVGQPSKASAPIDTIGFDANALTLDLPNGWYLEEVPAIAYGPGAVGARMLYVFNRGQHALLAFHEDGRFSHEIGAGLFSTPHGMRIDADGNIWTTDVGNHLVLKFSPAGDVLMVLGKKGTASPGWFHRDYNQLFFDKPSDVAFDKVGNIYVADGGNFRIVKFSPEGDVLALWGEKGDRPGLFNFPHALVVGDDNRLYVADRENQRIQIFGLGGDYLESWDGFGYPYLLEKAAGGGLWVSDARADQLVQLNRAGEVTGRFGGPGKRLGTFGFLHGVAPVGDGQMLVSDILNWRIQQLRPAADRRRE